MKNSTRTLTLVFCYLIGSLALVARERQNIQPSPQASATDPGQSISPNAILPFYTEDFGSGLPASWQAIDSAGNGLNWKYTTTGADNGDALSATGTSAANGYMIYDSDSAGGLNGPDMADLISGPIDCSTHPNVHLNFNEYLVYFNDTAIVYISTDGTNWTEVHNASAGLTMFQATPNPRNVEIDISSIAANQDSVWIRFSYHADYSFYWMIDDVILHEVASQDASLSSITSPSSSCTLLTNAEPISIAIYNEGGTSINSCIVTYSVDGGAPVSDTVNAAIAVGITYPYTFATNADLSAPGVHTIQAYVTLAGDTNSANDTVMATIFNGPHVIDALNDYQNGFEMTDDFSTFDIEDANMDSVSWVLDTNFPYSGSMCAMLLAPVADDWLYTTCLDLDSGVVYALSYYARKLSTAQQANLQIAIGNAQNAGAMGQLIYTNSPVNNVIYQQSYHIFTVVSSGTYYIGFEVSNADSAVSFVLDDINIKVDDGTGIKENLNDKVSVYPNPSTGLVFINSTLQSSKGFVVEITNSIGVLTDRINANDLRSYSVDMSGYTSGIYIVRIISENGISTHKISLKN